MVCFRILFCTNCLTLIAFMVYVLRKAIQIMKEFRRKNEVVEIRLAPIRNSVVKNQNVVENQNNFNNKCVNDQIVTTVKMFTIFAFVTFFAILVYFYAMYFAQFAHRANFVIFVSTVNRFIFVVIVPSIMYFNNSTLRNFVISGIRNCVMK